MCGLDGIKNILLLHTIYHLLFLLHLHLKVQLHYKAEQTLFLLLVYSMLTLFAF